MLRVVLIKPEASAKSRIRAAQPNRGAKMNTAHHERDNHQFTLVVTILTLAFEKLN